MLTLGIDDAGRGPIIGPMILAGVLVDKTQEEIFKKHKIRDSKKFAHNHHRIKLAKIIKENSRNSKIVKSFPDEIDFALSTKTNLNTLEAIKTAEIINALDSNEKIKVIVDCPSVNTFAWKKTLLQMIENPENLEVHCEHKADVNYLAVSAASILAKVAREEEVEKLKSKYGELGSGYPADPLTKEFLKKNGKALANEKIFRKSWATWRKLFPAEQNQTTLGNF